MKETEIKLVNEIMEELGFFVDKRNNFIIYYDSERDIIRRWTKDVEAVEFIVSIVEELKQDSASDAVYSFKASLRKLIGIQD